MSQCARCITVCCLLMAALSSLLFSSTVAAQDIPEGVPRASERATVTGYVDGDTFKVSLNGKGETVHLLGIDAPEINECFGQESADRVQTLLERKAKVYLEAAEEDRNEDGELLRYVWVVSDEAAKAYLLNTKLVREGFAAYDADFTGGKYESNLQSAQDKADDEQPGLWAACGGPHEIIRTPEDIKAEYAPLADVRELAIRPGGMIGQKIFFTGTIFSIQVAAPGNAFFIGNTIEWPFLALIQVEIVAPDGSTEIVLVGFDGDTTGMFDNTFVAVYATVVDTATFTNAFGGQVTQPLLSAEFVELA